MRAYERFLNYAKVNTESADGTGKSPSTDGQWDLARLLVEDVYKRQVVTTATPADNVYVYDLGEGALDNPVRPDTPYRMQGVIAVPEGENLSLIHIFAVSLAEGHFRGFDYYRLPEIFDSVTKADVEAFLREEITQEHAAISVIRPLGGEMEQDG